MEDRFEVIKKYFADQTLNEKEYFNRETPNV